jgi:hypothetical protein
VISSKKNFIIVSPLGHYSNTMGMNGSGQDVSGNVLHAVLHA